MSYVCVYILYTNLHRLSLEPTQCCGIQNGQSDGIRTDNESKVKCVWGGSSVLDCSTVPLHSHPLHHSCEHTTSVVTYADQHRILELTRQLREMVGREKLTL